MCRCVCVYACIHICEDTMHEHLIFLRQSLSLASSSQIRLDWLASNSQWFPSLLSWLKIISMHYHTWHLFSAHLYNVFLSIPTLFLTLQFIIPPHTIFPTSCSPFLKPSECPLSTTCMITGGGTCTKTWLSSRGPHPWKKLNLNSQGPSLANSSSARCETPRVPFCLCWDFDRLDLQVFHLQSQPQFLYAMVLSHTKMLFRLSCPLPYFFTVFSLPLSWWSRSLVGRQCDIAIPFRAGHSTVCFFSICWDQLWVNSSTVRIAPLMKNESYPDVWIWR